MLNNIIKDNGYTGNGDRERARRKFFAADLPKKAAKIEAKIQYEFDDSQGQGAKINIPSNIIDI